MFLAISTIPRRKARAFLSTPPTPRFSLIPRVPRRFVRFHKRKCACRHVNEPVSYSNAITSNLRATIVLRGSTHPNPIGPYPTCAAETTSNVVFREIPVGAPSVSILIHIPMSLRAARGKTYFCNVAVSEFAQYFHPQIYTFPTKLLFKLNKNNKC